MHGASGGLSSGCPRCQRDSFGAHVGSLSKGWGGHVLAELDSPFPIFGGVVPA